MALFKAKLASLKDKHEASVKEAKPEETLAGKVGKILKNKKK